MSNNADNACKCCILNVFDFSEIFKLLRLDFFMAFVLQNFPLFLLICDHNNRSAVVLKCKYSDKVSYVV